MDEQVISEEAVVTQVTGVLRRFSSAGLDPAEINADTALLDEGLSLDSVELLESLIAIEETVGVRLREEELSQATLSTVGTLSRYIHQKISAG